MPLASAHSTLVLQQTREKNIRAPGLESYKCEGEGSGLHREGRAEEFVFWAEFRPGTNPANKDNLEKKNEKTETFLCPSEFIFPAAELNPGA